MPGRMDVPGYAITNKSSFRCLAPKTGWIFKMKQAILDSPASYGIIIKSLSAGGE